VYSANADVPMKWRIGSPSRPRFVRSLRQWTHCRHCGEKSVTTWSPGLTRRHVLADLLDDAGALVAEHGRCITRWIGSGGRVQVGVADAARDEPDERLARFRLRQVDLLDGERLPELLEDCGPDPHGPMLAQARPNRVLGCLRDGADTRRRR
jgi:hypothetical protein